MSTERVACLAALAVLLASPSAFADDPGSLEEVVAHVNEMKANAASTREMADYVMGVVDRRIVNDNGFEGIFKRGFVNKDPHYQQLFDDFEKRIRPQLQKSGPQGREYETFARWAWDNHYGQCSENSAIVYFIFKNAGIKVDMFERPGHAFAAIGMKEGYDPADLSTYGPDAYFVDPWFGVITRAETAGEFKHTGQIFNGLLHPFGPTKDDKRTQVSGGFDNPKAYQRFMDSAFLAVQVFSLATGEPVKNAQVTASSDSGGGALTGSGAAYVGYFPAGPYTVAATSSDGHTQAQAQYVTLVKGTRNELTLNLRDDVNAGPPPEQVTLADWLGLWKGRADSGSLTVGGAKQPLNNKPVTVVIYKTGTGISIASADKGGGKALALALEFVGDSFTEAVGKHTIASKGSRLDYEIHMTMKDKALSASLAVHFEDSGKSALFRKLDVSGTAKLTRASGNAKGGK